MTQISTYLSAFLNPPVEHFKAQFKRMWASSDRKGSVRDPFPGDPIAPRHRFQAKRM